MTGDWLGNESAIRLGFFVGVLLLMMAWEGLAPRRRLAHARGVRWPGNLGVALAGALLVRLLYPFGPTAVALIAAARGWGLFNMIGAPDWLAVVLAVVVLDLAIYGQHVMFHLVPWLWRLHRMHHADLGFDATTGVRFHPLEIVLSIAIKMAVVVLIGAPALAVLAFEVLLNATSVFNHGNVRMPPALDRGLRFFLVTPEMHRVHHSIHGHETDSNFGFNLPWWDRLFGTYRDQPEDGHEAMTIGIGMFREPSALRLDRMLAQPFLGRRARGGS